MVYKIEIHFETYMWNEAFHHASRPWMIVYTDNKDVSDAVKAQGEFSSNPNPRDRFSSDQDFSVRVLELTTADYDEERQRYSNMYLETLSEYQPPFTKEDREWIEAENKKFDTLITIDDGHWTVENCLDKIQEGLDLWTGL